jgi:hypothetical protein
MWRYIARSKDPASRVGEVQYSALGTGGELNVSPGHVFFVGAGTVEAGFDVEEPLVTYRAFVEASFGHALSRNQYIYIDQRNHSTVQLPGNVYCLTVATILTNTPWSRLQTMV